VTRHATTSHSTVLKNRIIVDVLNMLSAHYVTCLYTVHKSSVHLAGYMLTSCCSVP